MLKGKVEASRILFGNSRFRGSTQPLLSGAGRDPQPSSNLYHRLNAIGYQMDVAVNASDVNLLTLEKGIAPGNLRLAERVVSFHLINYIRSARQFNDLLISSSWLVGETVCFRRIQ